MAVLSLVELVGVMSVLSDAKFLVASFYSPYSINMFWNGGSSAGVSLLLQVVSRLLMSIFIVMLAIFSFFFVEYIIEELFLGSGYRYVHANMCSLVFFVL